MIEIRKLSSTYVFYNFGKVKSLLVRLDFDNIGYCGITKPFDSSRFSSITKFKKTY